MTSSPTSEAVRPTAAISAKPFWPRELALGLLPLLIGFQLIASIVYFPLSLRGMADFRTLYASAYMTRMHRGAEVYDSEKLLQVKESVAPLGKPFLQPMDHPAYQNLIFLPFSYLSYRRAFIAFAVVNAGLLVLSVCLVWPYLGVLRRRWKLFPVLLFAAFFPITRAITQGQDSILLLVFLAGAFGCVRRNKDFNAGLLTGLGLFKFQIVIPIALLFLIWKRWRFALGFSATAIAALLVSWVLVGTQGARQYLEILLDMSLKLRTQADAVRSSVSPLTMLNLRGVLSALFHGGWWLQVLVGVSSLIVLWISARRLPSMPLAIITAALVSYHLNVQDASMLIIPMGLSLASDCVPLAVAALATLIVPISAMLPLYGFFGGFAILGLFVAWVASLNGPDQNPELICPDAP